MLFDSGRLKLQQGGNDNLILGVCVNISELTFASTLRPVPEFVGLDPAWRSRGPQPYMD